MHALNRAQEGSLRAALISSPTIIEEQEGGLLQSRVTSFLLPTPSEPLCFLLHQTHLSSIPTGSYCDALQPPCHPLLCPIR